MGIMVEIQDTLLPGILDKINIGMPDSLPDRNNFFLGRR